MSTFLLDGYDPRSFYCELSRSADNALLRDRLAAMPTADFKRRVVGAEQALYNLGITFTVYSEQNAIDRILPFDAIPRVVSAAEWAHIERGVIQRVTALNILLDDLYHERKILRDGVIPAELVLGNANFRPVMQGLAVRHKAYVNICGIDIIRDGEGTFRVLEDNARTPSGVSYVIENRHTMLRSFPDLLDGIGLRGIDDYGMRLGAAMREIAPAARNDPQIVLLSPGVYNSAYFEHVFLAREMGVPLVEGRDLVVENDRVYMRTIGGLRRVDVIYRRINDDFLDPEVFRPDSQLGVAGLMRAYSRGNVALANAIGTGVADDKAVYAYVPDIIRYYLGEDPILPNVETFLCREVSSLSHVLANLERMVVKAVGASGGYGMLVGPHASAKEREAFASMLKANPTNYVAQPVIQLSTAPCLVDGRIEPRHVDLRPFILSGERVVVTPGALTRVALKKGSLVVNSSQGGGSKDTWVLGEEMRP
jgi:uncharacterized circularly permuted ATP-grasp superfamily protein